MAAAVLMVTHTHTLKSESPGSNHYHVPARQFGAGGVTVKTMGYKDRLPGFQAWLCHFLAGKP